MHTESETGTILVIGALGQIGRELVEKLRALHGNARVVASDLRPVENDPIGTCIQLDVLDKERLFELIESQGVDTIYHLAAVLSARGEADPLGTWDINMTGLLNGLEALRHTRAKKLFWPSSIAVFGPHSPSDGTPQYCPMDPDTVYGISKLAGERWCEYYHDKYGVDVRSIRYPGLIGYKSLPGGGTTDYAVEIFHEALRNKSYDCFLDKDTALPMMYMPDAIRATLKLMEAPAEQLRVWSSYNLGGISFSPEELTAEIQKFIPEFSVSYSPDFRDAIARSWPSSIDETYARQDWNWQAEFDLGAMVKEMIEQVRARYFAHDLAGH